MQGLVWLPITYLDQWPDLPVAHNSSREKFNILCLDRLLVVPFHDAHRTQKEGQLTSVRERGEFAVYSIA